MSLKDLLSFAPVPALDTVVTLLTSTYSNIQKIGVYRKQCEDMFGRCCALMVKLREGGEGLEGSKALRLADELEPGVPERKDSVLERISVKTRQWSEWGPLECFLKQAELKDDLDRLQRQLDGAILNFGAAMNLELQRTMYRSEAIHHATREEFRASLQAILDDQRELKKLLAISSPQPVEEVMMHLQTELQDPNIPQEQHDSFQKGLWDLRSKTAKLPPLTDLTGQVELNDRHPEFIGTYNDVYKGTWLGKEQVAVRLPRTLSDTAVVHKKFQQEVEIWRAFDHPNVLPLYGIVYIGKHLYSVAPWMTYGTAISFVEKYPQTNVLKLLSEVTEGLGYLHSKGIVHGDLRGANVLISEDGVARLSDFGLSKFLENCNKGMTSAASINPRWQAPEIIREKPLSRESDIWSLAMTFMELLTRHQPYSNIVHDFNVGGEVKKYKTPQRPKDQAAMDAGLNDEMWELMKQCWKKPEDRPTVDEVKLSLARIRGEIAGDPRPPKGRMSSLLTITGKHPRKNSSGSSRPSTATSGSSGGSSSKSTRPAASLAGLSIQGLQLQDYPQPGNSSLSPPFYAGTSPPNSWSSHSPGSAYSPLSSYSPVQPNRRPSHASETQISPALSNFLSSPVQPNRRPSHASETQPVAGFLNSRTSLNQSSSQGHDNILIMEHSSAPRVQLFHLEHDSSSYQPRIPPRAYTDSHTYRATAQSIMTVESVNQDPLVQEAISSKEAVVFVNQSGFVIAGTLDGLVERLINNFNLQRDEEFREVILTACVDLIETDDLFGMLKYRFNEAELDTLRHPQDRMTAQHNVFKVLQYWLSSRQIPVNGHLLLQMRVFCEEAVRTKVSPTMVERAAGLLDLINERARQDSLTKSVLSPGRRVLQPNEVTPKGLALALTLLEGDKYRAILPCDYLANQCGRPGFNRVDDAASTNNQIIQWIKQSLLHWDALQQRAGVLKFYISTAQECRKLRNYHSLIAIAIALGSTPVMSLELTREFLSDKQMVQYEELVQLTDPEGNHYRYRRALKEVIDPAYADFCIPWIAVHLKELHLVLHANKRAIIVKNKPLINFQRYTLFMDKLKEVLAHSPPDLERFRQQGELAYLEDKLRNVRLGEQAEEEMDKRSRAVQEVEVKLDKSKVVRAMKLGMNVPKAAKVHVTGRR